MGAEGGDVRSLTWVFVFLEVALSGSSVSEATFSRWRLVLFRGDAASPFTFCSGSREVTFVDMFPHSEPHLQK